MVEQFDQFQCPFCHQSNACGAQDDKPCWCFTLSVPQELLALLPEQARRKACVCQRCVESFNQDPAAFKASLA
ncbi:MAG: cysteine-rich CWC family protein [Candidatus Pelagadaptatus aseana]|uniref:cysteine-rich CWC family protein n=1 Tax=Candidatus Pelagadaptatus aseana TaxID=3120508 RepID=UPI0039B16538